MVTMCEFYEEQLSASDAEEGHNNWNVFVDLNTTSDFGARLQLRLEDEEIVLYSAVIMRWAVCWRSCTRSEGCLTMIEIVSACPVECSSTDCELPRPILHRLVTSQPCTVISCADVNCLQTLLTP